MSFWYYEDMFEMILDKETILWCLIILRKVSASQCSRQKLQSWYLTYLFVDVLKNFFRNFTSLVMNETKLNEFAYPLLHYNWSIAELVSFFNNMKQHLNHIDIFCLVGNLRLDHGMKKLISTVWHSFSYKFWRNLRVAVHIAEEIEIPEEI